MSAISGKNKSLGTVFPKLFLTETTTQHTFFLPIEKQIGRSYLEKDIMGFKNSTLKRLSFG